MTASSTTPSSWGYIYRHPLKVARFPQEIEDIRNKNFREGNADAFVPNYFIHKSVTFIKKHTTVRQIEKITPIGFIFLQGATKLLRKFLADNFPTDHLINNPLTGSPAEIPDEQMQPFMRVMLNQPDRIKQLDKPISYFKEHPHIRILSGILQGLEGYVVRVNGSRSLVIDFAGRTVAIKDILREDFEPI